ncbi:MAG: multi-sensor hybrid histidine kinase [Verrucomicrobiales bacterium]|nr:multi-sensor hybrid histidine kinase [Verrucomicrobiales bacterium]
MKTIFKTKSKQAKPLAVAWGESGPFAVPIPKDEPKRMATLRKYHILDTPPEDDFDNLATLAAQICGTPIALVTIIDCNRQWFKSRVGLDISETSRDVAFCAHAIMQRKLFIVPDTLKDKRFANNPFVKSNPKIRFYAGMPLITPNNQALGTLCVLDRVPRILTDHQTQALKALGSYVMSQLESRRQIFDLKQSSLENKRATGRLEKENVELRTRLKQAEDSLRKLNRELGTNAQILMNLANQLELCGPLSQVQQDYANLSKSTCQSLLMLTRDIQPI